MPVEIPGVKIDFYGRPLCGDCDAAKGVFKEIDVGYNYRDVRADQEANKEATDICKSHKRDGLSVPVIVIHHRADDANGQITFIEPRGPGLKALSATLLAFRNSR